MLKQIIKITILIIGLIFVQKTCFASYDYHLNIQNKNYFETKLIEASISISKKEKTYIDDLIKNKIHTDKGLITTYKNIKHAQKLIKGIDIDPYPKINLLLSYFEIQLGLRIHTLDHIKKHYPFISQKVTLEMGKYYLLSANGVNTIIINEGFSSNSYMDHKHAPVLGIYTEYEEGKFALIYSTFILPAGIGPSNYTDGYRSNIDHIIFDYKLIDYNLFKDTTLQIRSELFFDIKIEEITLEDSGYEFISLYENKDTYNIYMKIDKIIRDGLKK